MEPRVPDPGRGLQADMTRPRGAGRGPFQTSEGQQSHGALLSSLGVEHPPAPHTRHPWDLGPDSPAGRDAREDVDSGERPAALQVWQHRFI